MSEETGVSELNEKIQRLVKLEAALVLAGGLGIWGWRGTGGATVYLLAGGLSLFSFLLLAGLARLLGGQAGGGFPALLVGLLMGRFFLYGTAISGILRVYPKRESELLAGLLVSVVAILLEAIYTANQDART